MEKSYKELVNTWDYKEIPVCHKLAQFIFVVENDEESYEVVFATSYDYATKFFDLVGEKEFDEFCNEYTSEESQALFDSALFEGEIQFCRIN